MVAGGLIAVDDPGKPDVRALLERHRAFALGQTPPEHSFALDADALRDPAIAFFSFRDRGSLETGTTMAFAAARALYHSAGFTSCGPFACYQPSEDNLFMSLELAAPHRAGH